MISHREQKVATATATAVAASGVAQPAALHPRTDAYTSRTPKLFVAEGVDGVHAGGSSGGVEAEEQADEDGNE